MINKLKKVFNSSITVGVILIVLFVISLIKDVIDGDFIAGNTTLVKSDVIILVFMLFIGTLCLINGILKKRKIQKKQCEKLEVDFTSSLDRSEN